MKQIAAACLAGFVLAGCTQNSAEPQQPAKEPEKPRTPPIEYKGSLLGQKPAADIGAGSSDCTKVMKKGEGSCIWWATYAQQMTKSTHISLREGVLYSVTIYVEPSVFDDVAKALVEKYGPPKTEQKAELSNAMGARFGDRLMQWRAEDGGEIFAQKYVGDITTSVVTLSSPKAVHDFMERLKAKKPNASDL